MYLKQLNFTYSSYNLYMQKTHKCSSNAYMQTNYCTSGKTIGQNVFVFDSIEQALNIFHVCAYIYLLPLLFKALETSYNTCLFAYTYSCTCKTLSIMSKVQMILLINSLALSMEGTIISWQGT